MQAREIRPLFQASKCFKEGKSYLKEGGKSASEQVEYERERERERERDELKEITLSGQTRSGTFLRERADATVAKTAECRLIP